MLLSVPESRAMAAPQLYDPISCQLVPASQSRRMSGERERESKFRRASTEYLDTSGANVDLHTLLADTFSLNREVSEQLTHVAATSRDKVERKLLPRLSSLKRRRRCTALYLLTESELKGGQAS